MTNLKSRTEKNEKNRSNWILTTFRWNVSKWYGHKMGTRRAKLVENRWVDIGKKGFLWLRHVMPSGDLQGISKEIVSIVNFCWVEFPLSLQRRPRAPEIDKSYETIELLWFSSLKDWLTCPNHSCSLLRESLHLLTPSVLTELGFLPSQHQQVLNFSLRGWLL
jgi:hypothetical protein